MRSLSNALGYRDHGELGPPILVQGVNSTVGPFHTFTGPTAKVVYPDVVVRALGVIYAEYRAAFGRLIEANREWATDYQYCEGQHNFTVQIDMAGLPQWALNELAKLPLDDVVEYLRTVIFELESSIAMYPLLSKMFADASGLSKWGHNWRLTLDSLRQQFGKQIMLLAVTKDKYRAMLETEFGITDGSRPSDELVRELTGFDVFMGPDEFLAYLDDNGGECDYLIFARTSDPPAKLKQPAYMIEHPLLSEPRVREIIKACAITVNVDRPGGLTSQQINDTKAYMPDIGIGFRFSTLEDLQGEEFARWLAARGHSIKELNEGTILIRCKPVHGTGSYGHLRGWISGGHRPKKFRDQLRGSLHDRGDYVAQVEVPVSKITNLTDDGSDTTYDYIHRLFLAVTVDADGVVRLQWIGGFVNAIPETDHEAMRGRIHGAKSAVWAEIEAATAV